MIRGKQSLKTITLTQWMLLSKTNTRFLHIVEIITPPLCVRWTGYDMSSYSWENYKVLMHVDKIHDYLQELEMQSRYP